MAMHKHRNGQQVTCYMCKTDRHDKCVNGDLDPCIRCHCTCQPECTYCLTHGRPQRTANFRFQHKPCPTCHLVHAGQCNE